MTQTTLQEILQALPTLAPADLVQVQRALHTQLAPTGYTPAEERVLQAMLQAGLLSEIKPRPTDHTYVTPLVPIQGPPLSDTIREERR